MTESTSVHTSDTPETPEGTAMNAEVSTDPKTESNTESIVRVEGSSALINRRIERSTRSTASTLK